MDKNIIKKHLTERFVSEEATPGIAVTDRAKKESEKINKAGVKAIEKDVTAYDKDLKQKDKDMSKMGPNKFNYTNDYEKTYHNDMEILNGQEMIQYDRTPTKEFTEKAKEAIEGSPRMGNKGGKDMGNAEETWGASSDNFGKDLVKRIKTSEKKRAEQSPAISLRGKDIQDLPIKKSDNGHKPYAIEENKDNNKPQIKESMKRLKFNLNGDKPFKGTNLTQKLGHALTLIPEGYKLDKKEFEMTDGNVTCKVRWEGNLNEGKAVVLQAADKTMINEDMSRMKALMGYKSQDTLGTVKGNARLDENAAFADVWKKSRKLLGESDDIEDADAVDGTAESLDDAVNQAPEAKKHIEGSVSTEKGTQAPAPKKGEWEKNVKGQAAEAKKHIEGTTSDDKGTQAPAPKEGNWEEIKKKAPEATKDVETAKAKATETAKVVKEGIDDEEDVEVKDDFLTNDDDDSAEEKEPSADEIGADVPAITGGDDEEDTAVLPPAPKGGPKLMVSTSTGEHYLLQNGKHLLTDEAGRPIAVPPQFVELAKKNPKLALTKIQDEAEFGDQGGEEGIDEYGDEHPVSTADVVAGKGEPNKGIEEGLFGGGDEKRAAKEQEFDQVNAKLVGTKFDQTKNKEKWLERAKSDDNFRGQFVVDRGILQYKSKSLVPSTGLGFGSGTQHEQVKK